MAAVFVAQPLLPHSSPFYSIENMPNSNLPHDKSSSGAVIAQEDRNGKTRWLMRSSDGQFYLRDSDDNTELLSPEDAEKVYGEMPDKRGSFDKVFNKT